MNECNVKKITVNSDKKLYGVELRCEPNFKILGKLLCKDNQKVVKYLKNEITQEELNGLVVVHGHEINLQEVAVTYKCDPAKIFLDRKDESSVQEGLTRQITSCIQKLRKDSKLVPTQAVTAYCDAAEAIESATGTRGPRSRARRCPNAYREGIRCKEERLKLALTHAQ
ncbi:hypothetical protein L596_008002 [Steinernema carpocapsae]|uniref:Uncharacterized protein n=1 Tax=Steinernema carpocapsae TaxID=34508 RepID=A0A4U5PB49_STECR|nr:hypothetical protein L596_008002 [Steinernema carpocapsae]